MRAKKNAASPMAKNPNTHVSPIRIDKANAFWKLAYDHLAGHARASCIDGVMRTKLMAKLKIRSVMHVHDKKSSARKAYASLLQILHDFQAERSSLHPPPLINPILCLPPTSPSPPPSIRRSSVPNTSLSPTPSHKQLHLFNRSPYHLPLHFPDSSSFSSRRLLEDKNEKKGAECVDTAFDEEEEAEGDEEEEEEQ